MASASRTRISRFWVDRPELFWLLRGGACTRLNHPERQRMCHKCAIGAKTLRPRVPWHTSLAGYPDSASRMARSSGKLSRSFGRSARSFASMMSSSPAARITKSRPWRVVDRSSSSS